jgi:hypothetical protein
MEQKQEQQIDSPITSWNIHQRIIGIMSELHYIQKQEKTVNGQYRFVSHDQVVAKVQRMLVKYRVTTVASVPDIVQDGNCTRVKINVSFVNADSPGDNFTVQFPGYGIDGGGTSKDGRQIPVGDKGPGKAISYAYKYALLKLFNLETGEDPDNDAESFYEPPKCQGFDSIIPVDMSEKEKAKLVKFLAHSSQSLKKHVEDVKREALTRPEDFMKAFKNWKPKKED